MSLDHAPPALEGSGMFGAQRGSYDGIDQESPLGLEVVGRPRDIADIERSPTSGLRTGFCASGQPTDELVLPSRLGGSARGIGGRVQHRSGDFLGDEELGARPEALVREHDRHVRHHRRPV